MVIIKKSITGVLMVISMRYVGILGCLGHQLLKETHGKCVDISLVLDLAIMLSHRSMKCLLNLLLERDGYHLKCGKQA